MKNLMEFGNIDIREQYHILKDISATFLKSYKEKNSWKIRLIDSFIVFNAIIFIVQIAYFLLTGKFPMNSIVSGLVCCLGTITLTGIINN